MGRKFTAEEELKIFRRAGEVLLEMHKYTKFGVLRVDTAADFGFHFTWSLLGDQDWYDVNSIVDYAFLSSDAPVENISQEILRTWQAALAEEKRTAGAIEVPA